jgi:glycosidase
LEAERKVTVFEFHVSRSARDRYQFDDSLFSLSGNVVFVNMAASREFAHRMNQHRPPGVAINPGALNAMGMIDEALHALIAQYREQNPDAMTEAVAWFADRVGSDSLERTLLAFADRFPTVGVYRGKLTAREWLAGTTQGVSNRTIALEELLLLWLANVNPAFKPFKELFDDHELAHTTHYQQITSSFHVYFAQQPGLGPGNQNLIDLLRAPALAAPDSLDGQLAFIRKEWTPLLGDLVQRMLLAIDVLKEEQIAVWMRFHPPAQQHFGGAQTWGDSSEAAVPHFSHVEHEYERFSPDQDWMPRTVMMAKSVYVWLDQLSKAYRRPVHQLDQVPDAELDTLARRGFNGLWLIGIWERSRASQRIKQMCGNPEAAASAYSLYEYNIAHDLGGNSAYENLRDRAWARGIRLASDMVPNHMGIDSRWVIDHPDWFLSLPYSPFPSYSFNGPDVSSDQRVEIKIEDHYFDRSDAAVVFRRMDRWTGDTRYIYHGNDGTSFPWNDTAQLDYLRAEVREAVIQTILHVARMFPIIRFDAAMTLAKRHYQRLWFPEPGTGGAIPSRAEHGLTKAQFDALMPQEFWRELVDRVAAEAPGTLLLAEAFWLMEGYFVRTLGMHRVYNSAFMNMLRDEENANYRNVIKNTLNFDPDVLKRYVNFMNNPDERTAVDQFGKGDKYFGVCTLMSTLPGLPMFGHGQIEGYTERYGMEYRRAYYQEEPDRWLVSRHEREISPLLHRRYLFADVHDFLLYDFYTENGSVNEDVFAYSNRHGDERALVIFHNRYGTTRGWIRISSAYAEKSEDGARHTRQKSLGESFGFSHEHSMFAACRDSATGLEHIFRARDLSDKGMNLELHGYQTHVFLEWRDLREDAEHPWGHLCDSLAGHGVASLDDALRELQLRPVHIAFLDILDPHSAEIFARASIRREKEMDREELTRALEKLRDRMLNLLQQTEHCIRSGVGRATGLEPPPGWHDHPMIALENLLDRVETAMRLAALNRQARVRWPEDAYQILPISDKDQGNGTRIWLTVLAWAAIEAMGCLIDPKNRETAAAQVFDGLRLREPLAEVLGKNGYEGEEKWRAAARLRASFAHAARLSAPFSWVHDPDVSWVMGVHEYEGIAYVVKEHFERLLCWMVFRGLLEIAAEPEPDLDRLASLAEEISSRSAGLARGGYRVEALEDAETLNVLRQREEKKPEKV